MGRAKSEFIEAEERGWYAPETCVCPVCIEEEFLQSIVEDNLTEMQCSYCQQQSDEPVAALLSDVMPSIAAAFFAYYQEPGAAGLPRDSGEWVGEERFTDTQDALLSLGLSVEQQLFDDICAAFVNTAWVQAPGGSWVGEHEHDRLRYAWANFAERTKHSTRYFFLRPKRNGDSFATYYDTETILEIIGKYINHFSLFRELSQGEALYRARRVRQGEGYREFGEL